LLTLYWCLTTTMFISPSNYCNLPPQISLQLSSINFLSIVRPFANNTSCLPDIIKTEGQNFLLMTVITYSPRTLCVTTARQLLRHVGRCRLFCITPVQEQTWREGPTTQCTILINTG
jgi:hypothetical protein